MRYEEVHVSDADLLLNLEGELSARSAKRIANHIAACWKCRARKQELESAIGDFIRAYQHEMNADLPPAAGPRALLKARLAEMSATSERKDFRIFRTRNHTTELVGLFALIAIVSCVLPWLASHARNAARQHSVVSIPDPQLTPGATIRVNRNEICAEAGVNNKTVSPAIRHLVFQEYGITHADPRAYEIDYLVTPALGGADDIHNLWPHSNSATVWNAEVKDHLENRLRQMVCSGRLDLAEAQNDIAENWIEAYKKYFHTDYPLREHLR
jgi:hypothetical protein